VAEDLKKRNVSEFANILEGQLKYAERATQEAEQAFEAFRVNTITLPTEGGPVAAGIEATRDPALQSYFDQKIQYDNLRHDREALEKNVSSAASGSAPYEALLLIPSVAQSPGAEALREAFRNLYQTQAKLRTERQHFTDEHPAVKELMVTVDLLQSRTIPQLASQLLAQLRERELDYQRRIEGASRELQRIPPRTIEEMRLKRAVTVAEGLYTNLKARFAEARLAEASATPDLSVLDTAIAPLSPTTNTAPRVILMGIAGGLAAGLALAFLLDRLDRRIRYADQATSELGLVIAGVVPRIPKRGISVGSPEQVTQFVESFRTLRMHVSHSLPGQRVALAVTSAAPADGKSLIAANLALSFAEAGMRTVLVDADTRRGGLHKMFEQRISGGLTEYLAGMDDVGEIVRATKHDNLSFVSCGRRHERSPELLATQRLNKLLQELTRSFDIVIVDTPPLAAGIDAYALSAATGQVLLVLRMGETEKRLVSAKLAVLDRLPVNVVGAVLNGVKPTGEFQYYAYSAGYAVDRSQNELVAGSLR
jgi:capsular exopolysaccharide synthesis family protein